MQIRELMTRDVQVVAPSLPLSEAAVLMRNGDFGALPVGENDRLIGVVTDRDIITRAIAEGKDPKTTQVGDVMSEGIRWVYEDEDTDEAARRMQEGQIRRLPVINRDKRLVGIVSLGDFALESSEMQPAADALKGVSKGAEQHHRG